MVDNVDGNQKEPRGFLLPKSICGHHAASSLGALPNTTSEDTHGFNLKMLRSIVEATSSSSFYAGKRHVFHRMKMNTARLVSLSCIGESDGCLPYLKLSLFKN